MSVELTLACALMGQFEAANEGVNLTGTDSIAVIRAYAAIAQVEATREQTAVLRDIKHMLGVYLNVDSFDDDREAIQPGDYRYFTGNDAPAKVEHVDPPVNDLPF